MNDEIANAREAAEWIISEPLLFPCGSNVRKVAKSLYSLTDPTPLTVERLVEMGFKKWGNRGQHYVNGSIGVVYSQIPIADVTWYYENEIERHMIIPIPRTVGELNQLLMRMEEPRT